MVIFLIIKNTSGQRWYDIFLTSTSAACQTLSLSLALLVQIQILFFVAVAGKDGGGGGIGFYNDGGDFTWNGFSSQDQGKSLFFELLWYPWKILPGGKQVNFVVLNHLRISNLFLPLLKVVYPFSLKEKKKYFLKAEKVNSVTNENHPTWRIEAMLWSFHRPVWFDILNNSIFDLS